MTSRALRLGSLASRPSPLAGTLVAITSSLALIAVVASCGDDDHDGAPEPGSDAATPDARSQDASTPSRDAGDDEDAAPRDDHDAGDAGADESDAAPTSCVDQCIELTSLADALCAPEASAMRSLPSPLAVELGACPISFRRLAEQLGVRDLHANRRYAIVERVAPSVRAALLAHPDVVRELPVHGRGRALHAWTGEVIVVLDRGTSIEAIAARTNAAVEGSVALAAGTWALRAADAAGARALAARLAREPGVRWAEPNRIRPIARRAPSDPELSRQWFLDGDERAMPGSDIDAELAWQLTEGTHESVIAIYDDGVDVRHPDLAPNVRDGIDVPALADLDEAIAYGCCWHGTSVAGVAAAAGIDVGGRGVCPGCSIMPVFQSLEVMDEMADAVAMAGACRGGAAVVNNSWGPMDGSAAVDGDSIPPEPLARALDEAFRICELEGRAGLGTVIVFASGNGNESVSDDPLASHPLVVAVGASTDFGVKAQYSDFGPELDVVAPSNGGALGVFAPTLDDPSLAEDGVPRGYTEQFGGTSSAAPVVSGVIGLMLSANPALTAADVRRVLRETAVPIDRLNGRYDDEGRSVFYGRGLVNAYLAVRRAESLAGRCTPIAAERCNGVDDTCDGVIDEGCATVAICGACESDAECGDGASCNRTHGDAHPVCLARCAPGCTAGFACEAGLCVPEGGRCDPPADEVCNGVDDDGDGHTDGLDVCGEAALCAFDSSCPDDTVCAGGSCVATCDDASTCEAAETCEPRDTLFGTADGVRVCNLGPAAGFCVYEACEIPELADGVAACAEDPPASCDDVAACFGF